MDSIIENVIRQKAIERAIERFGIKPYNIGINNLGKIGLYPKDEKNSFSASYFD